MKTTLDIDARLLSSAKALAARERTTLTRVIEEGRQWRLRARPVLPRQAQTPLPIFKGRGGLVEGIDARSMKAMLEAVGDTG